MQVQVRRSASHAALQRVAHLVWVCGHTDLDHMLAVVLNLKVDVGEQVVPGAGEGGRGFLGATLRYLRLRTSTSFCLCARDAECIHKCRARAEVRLSPFQHKPCVKSVPVGWLEARADDLLHLADEAPDRKIVVVHLEVPILPHSLRSCECVGVFSRAGACNAMWRSMPTRKAYIYNLDRRTGWVAESLPHIYARAFSCTHMRACLFLFGIGI